MTRESLQFNNFNQKSEKLSPEKQKKVNELVQTLRRKQKDNQKGEEVISVAKRIIRLLKSGKREEKMVKTMRRDKPKGFPKKLKKKLYKRNKGCMACGGGSLETTSRYGSPIELHHIIPRELGGNNSSNNALIICRDCHSEIHNKGQK